MAKILRKTHKSKVLGVDTHSVSLSSNNMTTFLYGTLGKELNLKNGQYSCFNFN